MQFENSDKNNNRYINELNIRYITCLDCDYRRRIFDFDPTRRQRCCNELCNSMNIDYNDIVPVYGEDEIKCYGKFKCSRKNCNHYWTSYSTWIFYKQSCFKCKKKNHPFQCREVIDYNNKFGYGDQISSNKHDIDTCEYCQKNGRLCTKLKGNDLKYYP